MEARLVHPWTDRSPPVTQDQRSLRRPVGARGMGIGPWRAHPGRGLDLSPFCLTRTISNKIQAHPSQLLEHLQLCTGFSFPPWGSVHFPYPGVLHQMAPPCHCRVSELFFPLLPGKTPTSIPFSQGPCLLDDKGMKIILLSKKLLINYQFLGTPCLHTIRMFQIRCLDHPQGKWGDESFGRPLSLACGCSHVERHASTRLIRAPSGRLPSHQQPCWACQARAIQDFLNNHSFESTFLLFCIPRPQWSGEAFSPCAAWGRWGDLLTSILLGMHLGVNKSQAWTWRAVTLLQINGNRAEASSRPPQTAWTCYPCCFSGDMTQL